MRKSILFLTVGALALTMLSVTSCKKKDGVFNPKEKIHKEYFERTYVDSNGKSTVVNKKSLSQIYRWDKNKLIQIEDGGGWSYYFTYDGNQISKIEIGDYVVVNFKYDKADLKTIETMDAREDRLMSIITVTERSDRKITKFTQERFSYVDDDASTKSNNMSEKLYPIMKMLLSDQIAKNMCENMEKETKAHKATTITTWTSKYELTFEGNNVTKIKQTYEDTITNTMVYTYDSKKNPLYNSIFDGLVSGQSENNVTSYYNILDHDDVVKFEYTYTGDYPATRTAKTKHGSITSVEVDFYEYME